MGKMLDCAKVNPAAGCGHIVRGETMEDLMVNAKAHAKEHGITEITPELMEMLKSHIEDDGKCCG